METAPNNDPARTALANLECYGAYYEKPWWWFRLRYDTQVKRKTCLHLLEHGKKFGQKGISVFELGFGSAAVLFSFDTHTKIHGIEISRTAVRIASERAKQRGYAVCEFRLADGQKIPYPHGMFDILIASHVLEHVQDADAAFEELYRIARPNAELVVLVPINENYYDPNHVRQFTTDSLSRMAQAHGFSVEIALENELLFRFVERFYMEGNNTRWKIAGPILAALFNIPTALLPFSWYRWLDVWMMRRGWKPRQAAILLRKIDSLPPQNP